MEQTMKEQNYTTVVRTDEIAIDKRRVLSEDAHFLIDSHILPTGFRTNPEEISILLDYRGDKELKQNGRTIAN
jgi:hypothetical protein